MSDDEIKIRSLIIEPPPDPSYPDQFGGGLWATQVAGDDRIEIEVAPTAPGNFEGVRLTPENVRALVRFLNGEGDYR